MDDSNWAKRFTVVRNIKLPALEGRFVDRYLIRSRKNRRVSIARRTLRKDTIRFLGRENRTKDYKSICRGEWIGRTCQSKMNPERRGLTVKQVVDKNFRVH